MMMSEEHWHKMTSAAFSAHKPTDNKTGHKNKQIFTKFAPTGHLHTIFFGSQFSVTS